MGIALQIWEFWPRAQTSVAARDTSVVRVVFDFVGLLCGLTQK